MLGLERRRFLLCLGALAGSVLLFGFGTAPIFGQGDAGQGTAPKPVDTLTFVNGETLTGDLEQATSSGVIFNSPMAGEITVKWDVIKELKSDKPFAVLAKGQQLRRRAAASTVPQGAIAVAGKSLQVNTTNGVKTLPLSEIDAVADAATFKKEISGPQNIWSGWSGAVAAGVSLVRSTQNQTTFTGAINLVRAVPSVDWLAARNRTLVNYNQSYGSTTQSATSSQSALSVKTNIFHLDLERDQYLSSRLYYFGDVSFDHNFSQGLDLQQQYGVGVGWTVIKGEVQQLDAKADVHYQKQHFFDPAANPDQNLIGSTFGETYTRVLPRKIALAEFASLTESWNNTSAYSSHVGADLTFPVYKGLGFNIGAIDDYLNTAPAGFRKNSFQFTTGLSYAFKSK